MIAAPDSDLQAHSDRLVDQIVQQIDRSDGWLSFENYMQMALYEPGLGYYVAGLEKFGVTGDFVTAPGLGNLFARCLANQCAQCLPHLSKSNILEFGAGSGKLAADILLALQELDCVPDCYFILELSAELQQRQYETISRQVPTLIDRVKWLTKLPEPGFNGIIIANEVLDAMPVKRFCLDKTGIAREVGVGHEKDQLTLSSDGPPLAAELQQRFKMLGLPAGYLSEVNLQAEAWISAVGNMLQSGLVFVIDYGFSSREYYHPDRDTGTMMCHYQHHAHSDALYCPGLQDITAHVDFTAIRDSAVNAGLVLNGYVPQGGFLLGCGALDLLAEAQNSKTLSQVEKLALTQEMKKLTLPHEMGELFKVMALQKEFDMSLRGFSIQNRAGRL